MMFDEEVPKHRKRTKKKKFWLHFSYIGQKKDKNWLHSLLTKDFKKGYATERAALDAIKAFEEGRGIWPTRGERKNWKVELKNERH